MKKAITWILLLAMSLTIFSPIMQPMEAFATERAAQCPGAGELHTKENCTYEVFEVVPPVCDGRGYIIYACVVCGNLFEDDIVEGTGSHSWVYQEFVPPPVPKTALSAAITVSSVAKALGR